MKRINWVILGATVAYSFLFYHQKAGLNFFLFNIILSVIFLKLNSKLFQNKLSMLSMSGALVSATFILIYSSNFAVWANLISLALLSASQLSVNNSVLVNLLSSVYTLAFSSVLLILHFVQNFRNNAAAKTKNHYRVLTWIIPLSFTLIFFFIYKNANPLFERFTEKLNLNFITLEWIFFTIGGFFICWSFIKHHRLIALDNWEDGLDEYIKETHDGKSKWNEKKAFQALFILVNLMLFFMNVLDVNYLYLGAGMPKDVTHKQFVHNGVGMLILSIVLGMCLILYFFRSSLNFGTINKTARILVYIWIFQNLLMITSTTIRNNIYVLDALLTYKRLGVYYWLFMAGVGLVTLFIKMKQVRSSWYLIKANSFAAYLVLIASAGFDWDKIITEFNIAHTGSLTSLDKRYLLQLSETNIPILYSIKNRDGFDVDLYYHYNRYYSSTNAVSIDTKLFDYCSDVKNNSWKAFNFRDHELQKQLVRMNEFSLIESLDLSMNQITTLKPIYFITHLKTLNLSENQICSLSEFRAFPELRKLNLNFNHIPSLDSLPSLKKLTHLYVNENALPDVRFTAHFKSLEVLHLSGNKMQDLSNFSKNEKLKELDLSNNPIIDLTPLGNAPQLEKLYINNLTIPVNKFPLLPNLKILEINKSANAAGRTIGNLPSVPSLEYLSMTHNGFRNLYALLNADHHGEYVNSRFPKLQKLYLQHNLIDNISKITLFPELIELDMDGNSIGLASEIANLKKLQKLYLGNNSIKNIEFLDSLISLTYLNLSLNDQIIDFSSIKKLNKLDFLNLSNTRFTDLSMIHSAELQHLEIINCRISGFKGIERFSKLRTLLVSNIDTKDIASLKKLKSLKHLHITETGYYTINRLRKELPDIELTFG